MALFGKKTCPNCGQPQEKNWDKCPFCIDMGMGGGGAAMGGSMADRDYDDFARAERNRYHGKTFDECESDLRRDWGARGDSSRGSWDTVRDRVRSAWHKVERAMPGDADRDGR